MVNWYKCAPLTSASTPPWDIQAGYKKSGEKFKFYVPIFIDLNGHLLQWLDEQNTGFVQRVADAIEQNHYWY